MDKFIKIVTISPHQLKTINTKDFSREFVTEKSFGELDFDKYNQIVNPFSEEIAIVKNEYHSFKTVYINLNEISQIGVDNIPVVIRYRNNCGEYDFEMDTFHSLRVKTPRSLGLNGNEYNMYITQESYDHIMTFIN